MHQPTARKSPAIHWMWNVQLGRLRFTSAVQILAPSVRGRIPVLRTQKNPTKGATPIVSLLLFQVSTERISADQHYIGRGCAPSIPRPPAQPAPKALAPNAALRRPCTARARGRNSQVVGTPASDPKGPAAPAYSLYIALAWPEGTLSQRQALLGRLAPTHTECPGAATTAFTV